MVEEYAKTSASATASQESNTKQRSERECEQLFQLFQLLFTLRLAVTFEVAYAAEAWAGPKLFSLPNAEEEWQQGFSFAYSQEKKISLLRFAITTTATPAV